MKTITADPVGIARCALGEGPVWCPDEEVLHFVDIDGCSLHSFNWTNQEHSSRAFNHPVCCIAQAGEGALLVAFDSEVALFSGDTWMPVSTGALPMEVRFNDGKCDPAGRFFIGSTHREFQEGHGALFRLDGATLTPVLTGLGISNGLAWTGDGRSMFHIDTLTREIAVYDYELASGTIVGLSHRIDVSGYPGVPDGMTIDSEDCIWVAFWEGGTVMRFTRDGQCLQTVALPVPHVTSCTFAGSDLETLAITTADRTNGVPLHSGDVFLARPGAKGVNAAIWTGRSSLTREYVLTASPNTPATGSARGAVGEVLSTPAEHAWDDAAGSLRLSEGGGPK